MNNGVWWWGPLSAADQRSRLHSSMDAPKGCWVGRIKLRKKTEESGKIVLLSEQKNKLSIDVNAVRLLNSRGDCL